MVRSVNWMYVFWAWAGWITGILTVMQIQVSKARRDRHYMQFDMKLREPDREWNVAELARWTPEPRITPPPPPMEECPQCGKAYKRVKTHIAMVHKVMVDDDFENSSESQ
jgi:hypothetical protein